MFVSGTSRNSVAATLLSAFFLFSTHAKAVVVEYSFEATIEEAADIGTAVGGVLSPGNTFTAKLTYETDAATLDSFGAYQFPSNGSFSLEVIVNNGSTVFNGAATDGSISPIDQATTTGQDWLQVVSIFGSVAGDPINGRDWRQISMTLKDLDGTLYNGSNNELPDTIAALNTFEEAFFTVTTFGPNNAGADFGFRASISSIDAVLETSLVTKAISKEATVVLVDSPNHGNSGSLTIDLPDDLTAETITVTATYSQQSLDDEPELATTFFIPGETLQIWDIDIDNDLIGGKPVELTLGYDDTGMSLFEELALTILHFKDDGSIERLLPSSIDTTNNILKVTTTSFSHFVLDGSQVPVPATAWLIGGALIGLSFRNRRRKAKA